MEGYKRSVEWKIRLFTRYTTFAIIVTLSNMEWSRLTPMSKFKWARFARKGNGNGNPLFVNDKSGDCEL